MSAKLFVGNLSYDTTEQSLRRAFEACGTVVDAKIVTDRETGRSRGFAFVTMGDEEQASSAIADLDKSSLDGRTIGVELAKPQEGRGGNGNAGDRRGYERSGSGRGERRGGW